MNIDPALGRVPPHSCFAFIPTAQRLSRAKQAKQDGAESMSSGPARDKEAELRVPKIRTLGLEHRLREQQLPIVRGDDTRLIPAVWARPAAARHARLCEHGGDRRSRPSGFSHETCLPAAIAAAETSTCAAGMVRLTTTCTSRRARGRPPPSPTRDAVLLGLALRPVEQQIADDEDLDVREGRQVLEVGVADDADADDADPDGPLAAYPPFTRKS